MAAPIQSALSTKFPFGISSFGMPVVGGGAVMTTGKVFFVDSTASAKGDDAFHGADPLTPFATLDFAIGQCGANRGDTILVLPGHVENIISAAGVNCDIAGITIIAVTPDGGRDRAKFTWTTAVTASLDINAANVRISGFTFDLTGVDNVTAGINVKATDATIDSCEIILATASGQAAVGILLDTNSSRADINRNFFTGTDIAGTTQAIDFVGSGTITDVEIAYNRFVGAYTTAAIHDEALLIISGGYIHHNIATLLPSGSSVFLRIAETQSTGIIGYNAAVGTSVANLMTLVGQMAPIENYGFLAGAANSVGVLIPTFGGALASGRSLIDEIIGNQFSYNRANYLAIAVPFSSATWNTVGTHEILVVTGAVRLKIIAEITTTLTSGGAATLSLGEETTGVSILAATTLAQLTATTVPALWFQAGNTAGAFVTASIIDRIVAGGRDIGYAVAGAAFTGGVITFHCWWEPVNSTGLVQASSGIAL